MRRKSSSIRFVLFMVVATAFCGGAREHPSIVVATDATYPPMEFLDQANELAGFDIELMKAAARAGGFTVEFVNVPWDSLFAGLMDGSYDAIIAAITITEERRKTMDFSIPYIRADQVLVVEQNRLDVESIEDLSGKKIGVLAGSTSSAAVNAIKNQHDFTVVAYGDQMNSISDLLSGEVSAVAIDLIYARILIQGPEYKDKLKIVEQALAQEEFGVVVKKDNEKVLTLINTGLEKVLNSGESRRLEEIWLK